MKTDLFNPDETPFNLAGELLDEGITEEGEAHVRAVAEHEARKAQTEFMLSKWWTTDSCKRAFERAARAKTERINKLRADLAERRAQLDAQIWADNQQERQTHE